jgi:hypothetical protein
VSESWRVSALLVAQDERLMAGEEVDLVQVGLALGVDAAGGQESQGAVDVVGHRS